MWHTQENVKTYAGAFSLVLAYGVKEMIDQLEGSYEYDEDHQFGHEAFARLTLEQKAWTVHKVAFGLLDRKTPIVPLTAFSEATVATIFRQVEDLVMMEIDIVKNEEEPAEEWCFAVRRAIWAVYEKAGRNSSEYLEDDEPLKVDCSDMDEWNDAIESIEFSILWDTDFDFNPIDMHPELDAEWRRQFTIDDEYFIAFPDDPLPDEAKRLLKETRKLCDRIIKREEKKLA